MREELDLIPLEIATKEDALRTGCSRS